MAETHTSTFQLTHGAVVQWPDGYPDAQPYRVIGQRATWTAQGTIRAYRLQSVTHPGLTSGWIVEDKVVVEGRCV